MSFTKSKPFWLLLFLSGLLPLVYIVYQAFYGDLGAEPAKALVEFLGETALYLLFITLALTPMRKLPSLAWGLRYRRMLGLYAFFYAVLHLVAYGSFLVDWQNFIEDIYQRPYVTMGFLAFLILLVLAITSPKVAVRKLGRKWKSLHRWVYVAVGLIVIHVWWQARSDYTETIIYASIAFLLLCFRWSYFKTFLKRP